MKARLATYRDGKLQSTYPLPEPGTTIGRDADNHIQLDHSMVSRHHAAIHAKDGMWVIKDLSSTNGIEVNGVFVNNIMLKNMDVVSIAPFSLVFEVTENDDAWRPVAETQFATTRVALTPPEASERRPAPPTVQGKSASPKPSKP